MEAPLVDCVAEATRWSTLPLLCCRRSPTASGNRMTLAPPVRTISTMLRADVKRSSQECSADWLVTER